MIELLTMQKKISNNTFLSLTIKISSFGIQYLFIYLVLNLLGLNSWGKFALIFTMINIFSIVAGLGLGNYSLKIIPTLKNNNKILDVWTFYFRSLIAVLFMGSTVVLCLFILGENIMIAYFDSFISINEYYAMLACIIPMAISKINAQFLRALNKIRYYTLIDSNVFLFLFLSLLLIAKVSIFNNLITISLIETVFISVILVVIISWWKIISALKLPRNLGSEIFGFKGFKKVLKESVPMLFTSSLMMIMGWTDTVMLGKYVSTEQLGIYNTLFKISSLATISLYAVSSSTLPSIAKSYHLGDLTKFRNYISISARLNFFLIIPIAAIFILLENYILNLFDAKLQDFTLTLNVLIIGYFISALAGQVGGILQVTGKHIQFQNIILAATAINITANVILIPKFGILGAAIASSLSMLFWNLYSVIKVKSVHNIWSFYIPNFMNKK